MGVQGKADIKQQIKKPEPPHTLNFENKSESKLPTIAELMQVRPNGAGYTENANNIAAFKSSE